MSQLFIITMLSYLLFALTGVFAGFFSGLLGIGGGIVVVPGLLWVFGREGLFPHRLMHVAVGTALAVMIITALASLWAHRREAVHVWPLYKRLLPGLVVGVVAGVFFADRVHTFVLQLIFAVLLLLIALRVFFAKEATTGDRSLHPMGLRVASVGIGFLSGLLGLGGGVMTIPFLTRYGVRFHQAIAVSLACAFAIAVVGAVGFIFSGLDEAGLTPMNIGYVYWPAVLAVGAMVPLGSWLGACVCHKVPVKQLRRIFAAFMMVVGLRMIG